MVWQWKKPPAAEMAVSDDDESGLAVPTALTPADLGRDIIYRATISVQADDVTAASREAVAIVQGLGGIVFSQATRAEPHPPNRDHLQGAARRLLHRALTGWPGWASWSTRLSAPTT